MWNSKNIPYLITITKGACGDKFCCVDKFRHLDKFCHVEKVCHVQLREGQFPAFHVSPVVVLLALHCKKKQYIYAVLPQNLFCWDLRTFV